MIKSGKYVYEVLDFKLFLQQLFIFVSLELYLNKTPVRDDEIRTEI